MKVQDMMTGDVQCCGLDTNLAAAATTMWDSDCGALPVLNVQGHTAGGETYLPSGQLDVRLLKAIEEAGIPFERGLPACASPFASEQQVPTFLPHA